MCGIAGLWSLKSPGVDLLKRIEQMTATLIHRGPDDGGIKLLVDGPVGPAVAFGHRRLAIIDLSDAGHQPMQDNENGNWITYNGEIYNFRELKRELQNLGHNFSSDCDTEVILKAFAEWHVGCWRKLRGIYAFGLWDQRHRKLYLVRDHLGVKPLYYMWRDGTLAFASEVRALLASGLSERRLSLAGLCSYLSYGSVQEPCTLVEGIQSLPPGSYLACGASGANELRQYWDIYESALRNWESRPSPADVSEQLAASVRRQLVSDVPLGVFLSGGIDSTVIAALAVRARKGIVRTFCIGSDDPRLDESHEAAEAAVTLGCEHTNLILEGRLVRDKFAHALAAYDQPSYDGINTYFVSMLVRSAGIKVALSGLGGDELFVGYSGFAKCLRVQRAGKLIRRLPGRVRWAVGRVVGEKSRIGDSQWGAVAQLLSPKVADPYFAGRNVFADGHVEKLLGRAANMDEMREEAAWGQREHRLARMNGRMSGIERISVFELQTYMLSTLLRDSDQMSMAHGLELRVPLIDSDVVEQVVAIPPAVRVVGGESKPLLTRGLENVLPPAVRSRRKRGFNLPFQQWFMNELRAEVGGQFESNSPVGPWDRRHYRGLWRDFARGRIAASRLMTVYIVESWLKANSVTL